jgi:hypothetical protein
MGAVLQIRLLYLFIVPFISLALAGCNELALRKGPAPILDVTSVQTAAANQGTIIYALARDAGYANPEVGGINYYRVAEAGFNYVDDQCSAYFDTIFFLDRERSQLKSGLAAASSTTAAILGVTSASTLSLSVVASAFGLASAGTDILAGTYLYSLPPATTQGLVNKLQIAYRDAAARTRADITTPTAAYHQIQSYLALCLPPTIETEVANQVNAATAIGVSVAGGSIAVKTGSSLPDRSPISSLRRAPLIGPAPLTREHVSGVELKNLKNPASFEHFPGPKIEEHRRAFIRQVQDALCAPQRDGTLDPATTQAIQNYLSARKKTVPPDSDPFGPVLQPILEKAIDDVQDCSAEGFANAYEVGFFGVPASKASDKIGQLQSSLTRLLKDKGSDVSVQSTGKFDDQTRKAITAARKLLSLSDGDQVDDKLVNDLF